MFNGSIKFYGPLINLLYLVYPCLQKCRGPRNRKLSRKKKVQKKAAGKIKVHFKTKTVKEYKWILIEIEDDGRGIDPNIIGPLAVEKGVLDADQLKSLTGEEIIQLVMAAGFSSKEEATDMSGRGVGLDAIKFEAERLKGKAWVESVLGKGTRLFVEVSYSRGKENPLVNTSGQTVQSITTFPFQMIQT